ncbi:MAG TPA: AMP-binding protein [Casimicrobiaceae bacterium]|nr:AMP-binding protein [Casimicrobiaceae bacterium]
MTPLASVLRLADRNAYAALAERFGEHANRRFVESFDGRTFSYEDVERITAQMACVLEHDGVRKGDRVAGLLEKSPEGLMLYLAVARAGAVYMPISTALRMAEIEYLLGDARPRVAVVAPEQRTAIERVAVECGIERVLTLDATGGGSFRAAFEPCDAEFEPVPCTGNDANAIVYTSGTTGQPKGAVVTNGLVVWNAIVLSEWWKFTHDDVLLHANPPAFSLFGTTTPVLAAGASMILLPKFDAEAVVAQVPRSTVFAGVPTYYSRLLECEAFTSRTCEHMRLFVTGSAPMRPDLFEAFRARTGHVLLDRYGLTETLLVTSNPVDGARRAGDSGVPLPGTELRIVDETGALMPDGDVGAIEVRQPFMFAGYWNAPEKTAQAFRSDGFFVTGDFGMRTDRAHIVVLGRGTELIITGGLNVYPKEIENRINAFDNVAESAIIGVPHRDFGEAVVAIIERRDAERDLDIEGLRQQLREALAGYKVPKAFVVVPQIPRNALGKIQKGVLKQQNANLFRPAPAV